MVICSNTKLSIHSCRLGDHFSTIVHVVTYFYLYTVKKVVKRKLVSQTRGPVGEETQGEKILSVHELGIQI